MRAVSTTSAGGAVLIALTLGSGLGGVGGTSKAATAPATDQLLIDDLAYLGAFRLSSATFGDSDTNYAVGALAYNPQRHSIFIAGHAQHNAVAEFAIPAELGEGRVVADLPVVEEPLQPFAAFLDDAPTGNPDGIDRINGMHVDGAELIVNAERWYDASGGARDTTLIADVDDIDGRVRGYFELNGGVHAGGYMSTVPTEWQDALGGPLLTGWAANTSIISRHSVGPSLFTMDPADFDGVDAVAAPEIDTTEHMNFPYSGQRWITPDALDSNPAGASPLWNFLATARFGFIAPGTSTFVVLGWIGGVENGIGYKITQDDGTLCGGYCAYDHRDEANAYWLFDVNDILAADDTHLPRPYAYGTWDVPFDAGGQHAVIGGTFDDASSTLYLALGNAGRVGTYDRPPLIVAYRVPAVSTASRNSIERSARATARAVRVSVVESQAD